MPSPLKVDEELFDIVPVQQHTSATFHDPKFSQKTSVEVSRINENPEVLGTPKPSATVEKEIPNEEAEAPTRNQIKKRTVKTQAKQKIKEDKHSGKESKVRERNENAGSKRNQKKS